MRSFRGETTLHLLRDRHGIMSVHARCGQNGAHAGGTLVERTECPRTHAGRTDDRVSGMDKVSCQSPTVQHTIELALSSHNFYGRDTNKSTKTSLTQPSKKSTKTSATKQEINHVWESQWRRRPRTQQQQTVTACPCCCCCCCCCC